MIFVRLFAGTLLATILLSAADSKTVEKTLPLTATGSIVLDGHNGSIKVSTWDRPEVEVQARIELRTGFGFEAENRRRFDATRVEVSGSGDFVQIKSVYPEWTNSRGSNPEIHYTIHSPRTARWTIHDHNSQIEVEDLHAALRISTHNSKVIVKGLAGALELDTHNGNAMVQFASLTDSSKVEMHNGDVELIMPASSRFNLQTTSHNARIDSEFAVATHHVSSRGSNMEGTVNGGGPALRLRSHDGNFRLRAS